MRSSSTMLFRSCNTKGAVKDRMVVLREKLFHHVASMDSSLSSSLSSLSSSLSSPQQHMLLSGNRNTRFGSRMLVSKEPVPEDSVLCLRRRRNRWCQHHRHHDTINHNSHFHRRYLSSSSSSPRWWLSVASSLSSLSSSSSHLLSSRGFGFTALRDPSGIIRHPGNRSAAVSSGYYYSSDQNNTNNNNNNSKEISNDTTNTSSTNSSTNAQLVSFSSIAETPLDSAVMEKPYTVILMEDDVSPFFYHYCGNAASRPGTSSATATTTSTTVTTSWIDSFRSKIPRDYGMSCASVSLRMQTTKQQQQLQQPLNSSSSSNEIIHRRSTVAPISEALQGLRASDLPSVADAVLVTKGPVSSLCAQYYLESFSLKGLVMIDPILFKETTASTNADSDNLLVSLVSDEFLYRDDRDSLDRFRSRRLLVEPNAVPMMVVRTVVSDDDDHDHFSAAWKSSSSFVADRHGDPNGPYGNVPVWDLPASSDDLPTALLDHIDEWIDEELQW